jgi:hypothetical protein
VITTGDILARLMTACAADSALVACAQRLFGVGAVLTLQLGADPVHEITAQDCPLVGFLDAGRSETGRGTPRWSWPIEIHVVVCDERTEDAAIHPEGVRLRTSTGAAALDTLAAAVRKSCLDALPALGLCGKSCLTDLEPPTAAVWPRQRAILSLTIECQNCLGAEPALPGTEEADAS